MRRNRKKILSVLMLLTLTFQLAACGSQETIGVGDEDVALLDPVGMALNYDVASYRNIYNYKVYPTYICPEVEEYSFAETQNVNTIDTLPGSAVSVGQELISGDTTKIDEQIEKKEEQIKEDEKKYLESRQDMLEPLAKYKADTEYWEEVVKRFAQYKPEEGSPEMASWETENFGYEKNRATNAIARDKAQAALDQLDELYELDHNRAKQELNDLIKQRAQAVVSSTTEGELVSCWMESEEYYWYSDNTVQKNIPVAAVGDMSKKQLKCEYIGKYFANSAIDIYAYINGKRYEVEYIPMEDEEYNRLTQDNGKAYTTFLLKEDSPEINVGDYGVIVLMKSKRENVLSVDRSCIHKDGNGDFVYVVQGTETIYTPVKTGLADNKYIEILDGLKEGDKVQSESLATHSEETVKTTKGSVNYTYKENGYMFYPSYEIMNCPVEYGSCYFVKAEVSMYERVEKGQTLATIRVVRDDIALQRAESRLKRLQERLAEYKAGFQDDPAGLKEKSAVKYVENQQEQIDEQQKLIDKILADAKTTEIKSTITGIVIGTSNNKEDDLLYYKQGMFSIADETSNYVRVEDKSNVLNYGNQVQISYKDNQGQSKVTDGTVAMVNAYALTPDLTKFRENSTLIKINPEALSDMAASTKGNEGWWNRSRFTVTATVRKMDNVVLVPKNAVTVLVDQCFVNVKKPDGTVVTMGIVTGGSDSNNYWVIEGLTEGMEVCLK